VIKLNLITSALLFTLVSVSGDVYGQQTYDAEGNLVGSSTKEVALATLSERFEIGEELIVTIRVGSLNYGEVFAVVTEQGLFVNPEEVISVMNFPITRVNSDQRLALKGWYISENRTFDLILYNEASGESAGEVLRSENKTNISSQNVQNLNNEILMDFDLVASWFGLSLTFDSESLSVNAKASIPLPAQAKLKREETNVNSREHLTIKYPNFDFGYFERSHQMFDANLTSIYRDDDFNSFYSVVGIQDIAGFSTLFFVRGDDTDIFQSANVNFKRQSLNEDLLGPLNASTFQFGDVRPTRVSGVTGSESIGVNISNQKLGQPFDFEFTNITGIIQDGWDVELYQNGVLTRKELNTSGGQYEFLDIPLFANLNTFDVVKYGPQGQIQRERYERNLDADIFNPKLRYNVSLTQANTTLLNDSSSTGEEQDLFLSGAYSYSFLGWLSTRFSHNINLSDSSGLYSIGATARISPRVLSSVALSTSGSDTHTVSASLQSRLFDQFLNVSASSAFGDGESQTDNLALRMSGNLYTGDLFRLSYANIVSGSWLQNNDSSLNLNNTLTLSSRYGFLSHDFGYQETKVGDERNTSKQGGVTFSTTTGNVFTRLNARYSIDDVTGLDWKSAEASINYEFYNNLSTRFKVNREFETGLNAYQWSLQWQQPTYAIFSSLSHNSNDDMAISLNARFSMSEAPFGRGYVASSLPLTSNGLVAIRLYEDVNQNFVFDSEDKVLPRVKVAADQLSRFAESDEFGIAILDGVPSFRKTDLSVDLESLEDPYLLQSTENTSLTPREGLLTLINYPFVQGIEFEGELKMYDGAEDAKALRNAPIDIFRSNGEFVKTIKSEYDGYFYSDVLFPDTYSLRVSKEFLDENELTAEFSFTVDARKAGSFIPDVQLKMRKLPYKTQYQAFIGEFSIKNAAKAYLKIVQQKFKQQSIRFTLHQTKNEGKYVIGVGIFDSAERASSFCEQQRVLLPSCSVRTDRFKVDNNI
jgi:hypothetical protein